MNQNITSKERHDDKPHEECGVFGVYDPSGNNVATAIYYGLFANRHTEQEICSLIGADSLGYLSVKSLSKIVDGQFPCCDACFSGKYPVAVPQQN